MRNIKRNPNLRTHSNFFPLLKLFLTLDEEQQITASASHLSGSLLHSPRASCRYFCPTSFRYSSMALVASVFSLKMRCSFSPQRSTSDIIKSVRKSFRQQQTQTQGQSLQVIQSCEIIDTMSVNVLIILLLSGVNKMSLNVWVGCNGNPDWSPQFPLTHLCPLPPFVLWYFTLAISGTVIPTFHSWSRGCLVPFSSWNTCSLSLILLSEHKLPSHFSPVH